MLPQSKSSRLKWYTLGLTFYIINYQLGRFLLNLTHHHSTLNEPSGIVCTDGGKPTIDLFPGALWRTAQTISAQLLISDSRQRIENHRILGETGEIYSNWIWIDVLDQINIVPFILPPLTLPATIASTANRYRLGKFRVVKQKKYGLKGESLAVIGGQIEMAKKEAPLDAAKRELSEELSLVGTDWIDLGTYIANVNHGHGSTSCYLLFDASERLRPPEEFHVDELERQTTIDLTLDEFEAAVAGHQFREIKWAYTATMALYEVKKRIAQLDEQLKMIPLETYPSLQAKLAATRQLATAAGAGGDRTSSSNRRSSHKKRVLTKSSPSAPHKSLATTRTGGASSPSTKKQIAVGRRTNRSASKGRGTRPQRHRRGK